MFGRTGQVASEILRLNSASVSVTALGRDLVDLTDPDACAATIRSAEADVILNAAAYTAVDKAESQEDIATIVNGHAPGAMAVACADRGLPFLHISTDYVFDGSKASAWVEDDPVAPLGAYGRSKLVGELAIAQAGGEHVILRTAWVHAGHGSNFVQTMLRVGASRDRLTVVDDQWGGPTAAHDIAAALLTIARAFKEGHGTSGIFHFCGAPSTSWCGFAREIFAQSGRMKVPEVDPITTADWPTPAERPANSVLDCTKIGEAYGIAQPDWRRSLGPVLEELLQEAA